MNRISAIIILSLTILVSCKKDPTTPPANTSEGFLLNDNGTCQSAAVHGIWFNGVSSDSSYIEVSVKVTKKGPYHIITDDQDGVVFYADGNFTDTGMQKAHLKPKGLFSNWGTIHFLTAYNSSPCQLSVNIYDSAYRDQPDNTFQFTANGKTYKGTGRATYIHLPTYTADSYDFLGALDGYHDSTFKIGSLVFNFEEPNNYNHHSSLSQSFFSFSTPVGFVPPASFSANSNNTTVDINVIKSDYSYIYKFSGTAIDSAGNIYQITDGRFRADTYDYINYE